MRFSAAALLAFAASILAQQSATDGFDPIYKPEKDQNVPAGKVFEIIWEVADQYKDLKVDIELLGGKDPNTLVPLGKIASGINNVNGKYLWDVDSKLGNDAKYGLKISDTANADTFQWSHPFSIKAADVNDATTTMTKSPDTNNSTLSSSNPPSITVCTTIANTSTSSIGRPTTTSAIFTSTQPAITTTDNTFPTQTHVEAAASRAGACVIASLCGIALALLAV